VRWSRSPVTSSGEFSDTALFPWRTGADAMGSTLDEPAPAAVTTAATRRWSLSADLGLLCARLVLGAVAILHGTGILVALPRGSGRPVAEAMLAGYGFVRPDLLTTYLGWAQLVAGVLLVFGVFASFAGAALLAVAVAAVGVTAPLALTVRAIGPVQGPLLAVALTATVVLAGPGRISADSGRAWARQQTASGLVCLLLGVATGVTVLLALR